MSKRRLIVYLALFAGGLILIWVVHLAPPPQNLHVQVQFLGLTNTATGGANWCPTSGHGPVFAFRSLLSDRFTGKS